MMSTDTPQVWIGCLASYNAGRLIGEWVDATDAEEIGEAQKRVAAEAVKAAKEAGEYPLYFGEPEEFYVGDYDGFGDAGRMLGEHPSYATIANVGAAIEEHGEAFVKWLGTLDSSVDLGEDDLAERFEESYRGKWDGEQAYAMELVCEIGWSNVPAQLYVERYSEKTINVFDELASYVDWEAIARELFQHGEYTYVDGHVFEDVGR